MGIPVVLVDSGGIPVTESENGIGTPVDIAANGFGVAVTIVDRGGSPVTGIHATSSVAIFAKFTTPPTAARKTLIDNLNVSLINYGIRAKLDCLWVTAAADSQAARVNWITPGTNDLTVGGSPTFTADRGYAGDGGTGRLDGPNPVGVAGNMTQNSANLGVWLNSNVADDNAQIGGGNAFIRSRTTGNVFQCRLNDATSSSAFTSITDGRGHNLVSRAASGSYTPYKNGVAGTAISVASTILNNSAIRVCSSNGTTSSTAIVGAAHFGGALTDTEAANFYSALLTYMQGVGAV